MKTVQKLFDSTWFVPACFGVLLIGLLLGLYFNVSNNEITIRQRLEAQIQIREAFFDKVWKILNEKAQVADEYKQTFKEIYPALIEGRYGNDNGFIRRDFEEFNYIKILPDTFSIIITGVLSLLVCIGTGYFVVRNDISG